MVIKSSFNESAVAIFAKICE